MSNLQNIKKDNSGNILKSFGVEETEDNLMKSHKYIAKVGKKYIYHLIDNKKNLNSGAHLRKKLLSHSSHNEGMTVAHKGKIYSIEELHTYSSAKVHKETGKPDEHNLVMHEMEGPITKKTYLINEHREKLGWKSK